MKIVTQVLDSMYGKSAVGVRACLSRASGDGWTTVAEAETAANGCIEDWHDCRLERGFYRIVLNSDGYFSGLGETAAYPEIIVTFRMREEWRALLVRIMLTPYSYSTYFDTLENVRRGT